MTILKKIIPVLLLLLSLLLVPVQAFAANEIRPVALQGAMDEEVNYFLEQMGNYETETIGSYTFFVGKIDSIPVVVSRTEVGMVNAAASTTLLIQHYNPKAIINQGTSGGHDPDLHRYDIVVGEKSVNYGKYNTEHKDAGAGMAPDAWKVVSTTIRENGEKVKYPYFEPDAGLYEAAMSVADQYKYGKVVSGVIGSADEWNRELDRIKWLHENVGTSAEEMETAAAAQVAEVFKVPFLGIRILSNSEWYADEVYEPISSGNYCAEFVVEVMRAANSKLTGSVNQDQKMVPLRSTAEAAGAKVTWDAVRTQAGITYNGKQFYLQPGVDDLSVLKGDVTWVNAEWLEEVLQTQ